MEVEKTDLGRALRGEARPDLLREERLCDLLAATAARRPEHAALIWGERTVSYAALAASAERIAGALMRRGAAPGRVIGLLLPRGADLLIAQAGIARSGAAWLPFDADAPLERVRQCLEASGALGLVAGADAAARLAGLPAPVWTAEQLLAEDAGPAPACAARPDDPAYVIYTSGSTGEPKGILISHRSICHFLRSENEFLGVRETDVVYQGFSVAFDMSFEEIWISYLAGATVWVAPPSVVRDPDALAHALNRGRVTVVHAVPTLMGLIDDPLPTVRLINLGGEACPDALVGRLARPGRRLVNTYGPTETSVSASAAELVAGRPVTIGAPLPNYGLLVVDADLRPLPRGETGELCIFGPGLALGYLGRPDLTAEQFVANPLARGPDDARMYRTGDLALIETDAPLVRCLGRADEQVKVRGFRVELGAIEAALSEQPGVAACAVVLRPLGGAEQLAAFVVPAADARPSPADLRRALGARLPSYMVPAHFETTASLPRLHSGKVDKNALRAAPLAAAPRAQDADARAPQGEAERAVAGVWADVLGRPDVAASEDFFLDLGGHSLLAALAVSRLRRLPGFERLAIADLYGNPTVEKLARLARAGGAEAAPAAPVFFEAPTWMYRACAAGQALGVLVVAGLTAWQWMGEFLVYGWLTSHGSSVGRAAAISLLVYLANGPALLALSIALKWLLLGRIRSGSHPLWGWNYWRFWFVQAVFEIAPVRSLIGTPLINVYFRLMGARIGKDVVFASKSRKFTDMIPFDLITVGDGTSIGMDTNFASTVEDGKLIMAPVTIGRGCFVGNRCSISGGAVMEDGSGLGDLSFLPDGARVPSGEFWRGSPAAPAGRLEPEEARAPWNAAGALAHLAGAFLLPLVVLAPVIPGLLFVAALEKLDPAYSYAWMSPAISLFYVIFLCVEAWALKWLLLGRLKEGRYPVGGSFYARKWFYDQIMTTSLEITETLYTTLYLKPWIRALGARVGPGSELDEIRFQPDLFTADAECFMGGDVLIGAPRVRSGWIEFGTVRVGRRAFVGTRAVLPAGTVLGENVLIGALSIAPECPGGKVPDGTSWFGSPAISLPVRRGADAFSEAQTYRPPRRLVALRLFIEFFRVILPSTIFIALVTGVMDAADVLQSRPGGAWWLLALPFAYLAAGALAFLATFLLKWILIGRYRPGAKPIWCAYVWRSELVLGVYANLCAPFFLDMLKGTPFIVWPLRALGMKIGRRCYVATSWFTDFDLVDIGDEVAINPDAAPVTQLFEGRVMKMGRIRVGNRCNLSAEAFLQYDTEMEDGSSLEDDSLLMTGEVLPAGTRWRGIPARRVVAS